MAMKVTQVHSQVLGRSFHHGSKEVKQTFILSSKVWGPSSQTCQHPRGHLLLSGDWK